MSKGLVRRLAALGVGLTMAATMTTGVLTASAAAASTGAAKAATPKVSVVTPKASPKDHEGGCPVRVTFSSKVEIKPTSSRTRVVYRWLHGDGSKSKVKSYTLKGKSARWVSFKESATFNKDVKKNWQALQVLSPRKTTSRKGYFSVDCEKRIVLKPAQRSWVKAHVKVDRSTDSCDSRIDAVGSIRVGKPSWVKYRWLRNGHVVDSGSVKVWDDRRVHYSFDPGGSHKGWVALEIVRPDHTYSGRAYYEVRCEADAKATAAVSAPVDYQGSCPVGRKFHGIVDAHGASTTVKYRWAGPGYRGPVVSLYFPRHSAAQSVSHTVTASESGGVKRRIEIVGPNHTYSNTASTKVTCKDAVVTASISNLRTAPDNATCGLGSSPAVDVYADITVTGPTTLTYHWVINGATTSLPTTVELDRAGVHPVTIGLTPTGPPTIAGDIRLVVTAPNAVAETRAFSYTCPTA
ncbi:MULTISPECIES: hypothetical protein [unclassified Nonomuraea]|uniref:hypothetical protein n=1 Tax=unclassified Nonomuraea TaxID=2593643 RepID=UPI001378AC36|nr:MULTISPECIES: hypothetical protein [unclassified Nonomuraea]NBE94315.1 hypothetical protein [Nonomuraea sp. K271]